MDPCLFCQQVRKLSKEHLWPKWARRTFIEGERSELIPHSLERQGGVLVKTWNAPVFSATEKVVCEECNNGWMSALEQRANAHAEPMLLGEPQTLDREAKVSLSMWAYLKMLLVQQVDEPVLPRESYETFYAIQSEDLLPLNTSVFIAHHVGARQGQYQHRLLAPRGSDTPVFFIATFTVRQLVIQIAKNFTAHEPVLFERDPRVEGCDDLIWPATEDLVNWPRDRGLDDEALSVFTGPQPSQRRRWRAQQAVNAHRRAKNRARREAARQQRSRRRRR